MDTLTESQAEHRDAGKAAIEDIVKGHRMKLGGEASRDAVIRAMHKEGMTPPQISRALETGHGKIAGTSVSNVRLILSRVPREAP